jgi:hypothetical protein
VKNRQFKEFVKATGHVTFAEVPPDPRTHHVKNFGEPPRAFANILECNDLVR